MDFEPKRQLPIDFGEQDGTSVIVCLSNDISVKESYLVIKFEGVFFIAAE